MTAAVVILSAVLVASTVTGDKPQQTNAWTLKYSDQSRGGRFLNIPIHYGDWVPITAAKALVEEVARGRLPSLHSQHAQPAEKKDEEAVVTGESERRVDQGDVVFINHHGRGQSNHRQYQTNFRHHSKHPATKNTRRQDASKSIRYPPAHKKHIIEKQQKQQNRRNHKKPPPTNHFNQIGQNTRTKSSFSFVPDFNSLQALNPFNFFDQTRLTFTTPRVPPSQQHLTVGSQDKSYQESFNAIQTIPAPDLSKFGGGPPVIELDSGADGEIILGQPFHVGSDHDHLASFVSVDFDGFSPGDNLEKKAKKKKQQKEKQNLSIIVEGKSPSKTRDETDLVKFLNNDRGDNAAAFVIPSDRAVPQGFAKIDLPFMDPTKHKGELPKAFIAPKGIAIPDGYKGKPLPQQPSEVDVVTTERSEERPTSLFDRRPTPFQRTPASNHVEIKATPETVRLSTTSSSLFRGWEKTKQYKKDFLNKIKLKAREKYEKPESQEKQETNASGKFYVNNKIKEARKEFQYRQPSESTLPPTDVIIPVENKLNIFKAVSDPEVVSTETPLIDVISAGDYDNDPISLVFEPEQVALTQSTLEQAEAVEEESTSVETSTNFAPTVITVTTLADTTTTTLASSGDPSTVTVTTTLAPTTIVTQSSTSTTTTTTTTTTTSTTYENFVKVTTEDPFVRLEEVRKKKYKFGKEKYTGANTYQGDLSFGDDLDTVESLSTEAPTFNFAEKFIHPFRTRKNGEGFGKRTKVLKRRPVFRRKPFNNDRLSGSIVPTPNPRFYQRNRFPSVGSTVDAATSDEKFDFKKKLRPHFDGLLPGPWKHQRHQRPARRSTVAPPITVDAEIYEVHPETRLRITTQSPSGVKVAVSPVQTTTKEPASPSQDSDYSYQDDYVYEPTTQEPARQEAEETTTPEAEASPPLEYQEYVPTVDTDTTVTTTLQTTSTDEVHETADKHSVISFTETSTDRPEEEDEVEIIEEVTIVDDFDNEIPDQRVEESQQIETTWNGVLPSEDHTAASPSTRLSSYEKNVDTTKFGADTEYKQSDLTPQVNEHGKPLADTEKAKADDYATWQASIEPVRSYYEINRSDNLPPVVRIEEVEITEPKDYSEPDIIYDETKAGFEDDSSKDSFSVPVSVAFNVPDEESTTTVTQTETSDTTTSTSLLEETESTTEAADQTTTAEESQSTTAPTTTTTVTTTAEVPTTSVRQEVETTTLAATTTQQPTTTFRTYSLINRARPSKYEDVLLGLRGPTSSTTRQPSTTVVIDLNKSAHSVPDSLWSSYKKSLYETSTTRATESPEDLNETTETPVNIEIVKDLPKPTEHQSEVLVVEKFPKSYGYKGKNREKWINSRRFPKPRRPFFPLAPKQNNKPETTPQTTTLEVKVSEEVSEPTEKVQSVFTPTAPPSKSSEEVKTESAKHPLLNEIKNALYPRQKAISSIFSKQELPTRSKQKPNGVPRGANTDLFKSFGGSKLSQAEFERSILGVSTATEISVKSMICVKGRCFNADDMGKLLPTN